MDIPGSSGFELILTGRNVATFNAALLADPPIITVVALRFSVGECDAPQ